MYHPSIVLSEENLDRLKMLAEQVQKDKSVERSMEQKDMCGLLLFMLLSRHEPNISESDLDWLE
jgi:hypothetical protein